MDELGKLEIVDVPEQGRRYCIHLNVPDIMTLKKIKADRKLDSLPLGKYIIKQGFTYERI